MSATLRWQLLALTLLVGVVLWLLAPVLTPFAIAAMFAYLFDPLVGRLNAEPTPLSKFTTCVQIVYVLAQLLHLTTWFDVPTPTLILMWATVALTVASGLQYVVVWSLRARREFDKRRGAGSQA